MKNVVVAAEVYYKTAKTVASLQHSSSWMRSEDETGLIMSQYLLKDWNKTGGSLLQVSLHHTMQTSFIDLTIVLCLALKQPVT